MAEAPRIKAPARCCFKAPFESTSQKSHNEVNFITACRLIAARDLQLGFQWARSGKREEGRNADAEEKKKNVSIEIEQKLSSRHVLGGRMEEEEESIERAVHNMGFVWKDVSQPYSSSHGHYQHNEMLFPALPLFLRIL